MIDSKTKEMLVLYQDVLDFIKTKTFRDKNRLIEYYDHFYEIVKDHKSLIDEPWNKDGVTRHGWKGIKGTVSEMLTSYFCAAVCEWRVFPIVNKIEQKYGADLKVERGASTSNISVKSVKPWTPPFGKDTRLNLDRDFFDPGLFRVSFISLVDPFTKQLWWVHYEMLAREYCRITPNNTCIPNFDTYTYMFVNQFEQRCPGTILHANLAEI